MQGGGSELFANTNVNITGGTIAHDVYGGGEGGYSNSSNPGTFVSGNVDIKIGTTKIEICNTYEFEIFFLQIILNNPKFALYLLNLDEESDKAKISLKNLANKLIIESDEKTIIRANDFLIEFNKQ